MDLVEISCENGWDLVGFEKFGEKCSISWFCQASSGFGEITCQLTHRFWILEAKTRHRPSPASSQPNQMGWVGGLGHGFYWTPLLVLIPFVRTHTQLAQYCSLLNKTMWGPWNCQNGQYCVNCVWFQREKNKIK